MFLLSIWITGTMYMNFDTQIIPETVRMHSITKTCLYNFDPIKPHFYIVKLGFTGVYIIFFYFCSKTQIVGTHPPRRGGSNEYQQSMFLSRNMKKYQIFLPENFQFLMVKFSIFLNRRVFIMAWFESLLDAHIWGYVFCRCGSNIYFLIYLFIEIDWFIVWPVYVSVKFPKYGLDSA